MKREMLNSERAVWKRGAISLNIVMVAKITGSIKTNDLKKTWLLLQKKHPIINAHIELQGQKSFFSTIDTVEIPIREVIATTPNSWESEALNELHTPFDTDSKQPLIRLVLVQSSKRVELLVICHHCLCDGLSATYLIRDILNCISGQPELVTPSSNHLLLDKLIPPTVTLNRGQKIGFKVANFLLGGLKPAYPAAKFEMPVHKFTTWHLNQEDTASFIATCKKNRVTVHAAILAILQAAQYKVQGDSKNYFKKNYTPVSVRDKLTNTVEENFGLYASESYIDCPYNPNLTIWENGQIFHNNIKNSTSDKKIFSPILIANRIKANLFDWLLLYLYKKQKIQFGYSLSNLGSLNLPTHYGDLSLDGIYASVYVKRVEKTLALFTINKKIHFTLTYRPTDIAPETISLIKKEIINLSENCTSDQQC